MVYSKVRVDGTRPQLTNDANHSAVLSRDMRLTGVWREQTANAAAPLGFELNNPWQVGAEALVWPLRRTC